MRAFRFDVIAGGAETPDALRALALRAEQLGFTALHLGHHRGKLDPLRALVAVCMSARRLRVGTRVLNAGLMPREQLAHDIAVVDRLSGGRFELGVGLGWDRADFVAADRPFEPLAARARQLEATLRSLALKRSVPVVIGGQSDAALSVAARLATGVELTGARVVAGGHRPDRVRSAEVRERVGHLAEVAPQRFAGIELGVRVHVVMVGAPARIAARIVAAATGRSVESIMDSPYALVGTVDEVVEKIRATRVSTGITRYSVSVGDMGDLAQVIHECQ